MQLRIMADFVREDEDDFFGTDEDPQPYLFKPEYTEEELHVLEAEHARREAETVEQPGAEGRVRIGMDWWCRCGACQPMPTENECFCCTEWELVRPSMGRLDISGEEDSTQRDCVTTNDAFPALVNPAVVETFFHLPKINWKKRPRPSGPNGQLSVEQYRLVPYRIVLEWALKGETLGKGNRKPLPSCVVSAIRRRYPSPTGTYQGFQEAQDAMDML